MSKPTARDLIDRMKVPVDVMFRKSAGQQIAARVERVLKTHRMIAGDPGMEWYEQRVEHCISCGEAWPCTTVRILDGLDE